MKIGVLGEGVTTLAVRNKIESMPSHTIAPPEQADLIIASPGIPTEQFPVTTTPIISEIELAYRLFRQYRKVPEFVAVTGTNGKTTVTTMVGHLLDCPLAGNIGQPLISYVPTSEEEAEALPAYLSVELSSYQLETTLTFRPRVAMILNVTEDHLTRHGTMENYARIKANIFRNQTKNDLFIYNTHDTCTARNISECPAQIQSFDIVQDPFQVRGHLAIPGDHNVENALAAAYAVRFLGMDTATILQKLETFTGVEHRIEYVATIKGRLVYNDSKGTNPDSTIVALKALGGPGILILGGRDKFTSLEELCEYIHRFAAQTILIGEAADRFEQALSNSGYTSIRRAESMEDAVRLGLAADVRAQYLLLSPACASFDMYKNYEERGRHFKDIVRGMKKP